MTDPKDDPRLDWCRRRIPGFAEAQDKALKARAETEESRRRLKPVKPSEQERAA